MKPPPLLAAAVADLRAAPWMPPFRLVLRDVPGELGSCSRGRAGRFTVTISAGLAAAYPSATIPILCHEVGHMAVWGVKHQSDHGPAFGKAYSRAWRLLHPEQRRVDPCKRRSCQTKEPYP